MRIGCRSGLAVSVLCAPFQGRLQALRLNGGLRLREFLNLLGMPFFVMCLDVRNWNIQLGGHSLLRKETREGHRCLLMPQTGRDLPGKFPFSLRSGFPHPDVV